MAQRKNPKLSSKAKRLISLEGEVLALTRASEEELRSKFQEWMREAVATPEVLDELTEAQCISYRPLLLCEVANYLNEDAYDRFWRKWANIEYLLYPETKKDMISIRDAVRLCWTDPCSKESQQILNEWLYWRPSSSHLAAYNRLGLSPVSENPLDHPPFKCSVRAGKLVPNFRSLRALLIQGILENWQHFKYCANPSCPVPYFIAKRKDQTICDASDCKAEKQRQHALKWWRDKGNEKRRKTKTLASGKVK